MALIFLKLGGSLITDKDKPFTPRLEKIAELSACIADVMGKNQNLELVLGHGSGSFGHAAASLYDTRSGVSGRDSWHGFSEVWFQASELNRLVINALRKANLPALTFSPASSVIAHDGKVRSWNTYPLRQALSNGLLPVIHGDVVIDEVRGGTILSTEDLFRHLAQELKPSRILLAGREEGVWSGFPARTSLLRSMSASDLNGGLSHLGAAVETDVTGGMLAKVVGMLELVNLVPGLEVLIFSGESAAVFRGALAGEKPGTSLHR
jgi:isopentenyl phosphate kinase